MCEILASLDHERAPSERHALELADMLAGAGVGLSRTAELDLAALRKALEAGDDAKVADLVGHSAGLVEMLEAAADAQGFCVDRWGGSTFLLDPCEDEECEQRMAE